MTYKPFNKTATGVIGGELLKIGNIYYKQHAVRISDLGTLLGQLVIDRRDDFVGECKLIDQQNGYIGIHNNESGYGKIPVSFEDVMILTEAGRVTIM